MFARIASALPAGDGLEGTAGVRVASPLPPPDHSPVPGDDLIARRRAQGERLSPGKFTRATAAEARRSSCPARRMCQPSPLPPPGQEAINSDVSAGGGRESATETAAKALPPPLRLASPLAAARLPSRRRGTRWLGGGGAQPARRRDPSTGGHASSSSEGERRASDCSPARLFLDAALPWALARALGINKRLGRAEPWAGQAQSCAPRPTPLKGQPGPGA